MEVDDPQLPAGIPTHGTREVARLPAGYAYGALTLYGGPFQATSASPPGGIGPPPQPHIRLPSRGDVRFELCPFPSPVLRASHLVSLPPPTEMLQFGGFPLPAGSARGLPLAGGPIRGSPDLSLHAAPRGFWQLATPFLGARAEPSTRRRSSERPSASL